MARIWQGFPTLSRRGWIVQLGLKKLETGGVQLLDTGVEVGECGLEVQRGSSLL